MKKIISPRSLAGNTFRNNYQRFIFNQNNAAEHFRLLLNGFRGIVRFFLLVCSLIILLQPVHCFAQQSSAAALAAQRNGQHDFDFNFGKWRTHIRRLDHPLSGSTTWTKMEGTVTVSKIWDGKGQMEDIEANGPGGRWRGMTLFLYNPQTRQWSQTFANMSNGMLENPIIGEFKNGRGELYGQDTFNGRSILVRGVWSDIKPNSHKFEQSFSADGGKSWEVNFSGTLERIE
jgi:hypothetical protein